MVLKNQLKKKSRRKVVKDPNPQYTFTLPRHLRGYNSHRLPPRCRPAFRQPEGITPLEHINNYIEAQKRAKALKPQSSPPMRRALRVLPQRRAAKERKTMEEPRVEPQKAKTSTAVFLQPAAVKLSRQNRKPTSSDQKWPVVTLE